MSPLRTLLAAGLVSAGLVAHAAAPAPLHLEVYNPGAKGIFPVSSEIISGAHEAILIDAQFQRSDAEAVVQKLKASGKTLTTVYISQSDPDYYFGLDVIRAAFPRAKIVATPQTVAAIKASMDGKLAYWGPILKDNAPKTPVLPDVLHADHLTLEGRTIEIKELNGPDAARTYLWIPSIKTVAGGVGPRLGGRHADARIAPGLVADAGQHHGAQADDRGARSLHGCNAKGAGGGPLYGGLPEDLRTASCKGR